MQKCSEQITKQKFDGHFRCFFWILSQKPQQQSKRAFRAITSPNTITLSLVEGNASNLQVMGTIQTDSSAWWGLYTDQGLTPSSDVHILFIDDHHFLS
jgi:hypothetical protein